MKKIPVILIFIVLLLLFSPALKTVNADSGNAEVVLRIVNDGVYFYSSSDFKENSKLFLLTKTYFLIGINCGDYYAVQYNKDTNAEIEGFVKKTDAEIYEEGIPSLIYPVFKINTTRLSLPFFYNIDTLKSFNGNTENLSICYGKITRGSETYMLVYYEGQGSRRGVFYVNYADLEITEPEVHPIPIKKIVETKGGDSDSDNNNSNSNKPSGSDETIQIIIIVAVIIFAVVVVYFVFRPNNYKYKKKDDL